MAEYLSDDIVGSAGDGCPQDGIWLVGRHIVDADEEHLFFVLPVVIQLTQRLSLQHLLPLVLERRRSDGRHPGSATRVLQRIRTMKTTIYFSL